MKDIHDETVPVPRWCPNCFEWVDRGIGDWRPVSVFDIIDEAHRSEGVKHDQRHRFVLEQPAVLLLPSVLCFDEDCSGILLRDQSRVERGNLGKSADEAEQLVPWHHGSVTADFGVQCIKRIHVLIHDLTLRRGTDTAEAKV